VARTSTTWSGRSFRPRPAASGRRDFARDRVSQAWALANAAAARAGVSLRPLASGSQADAIAIVLGATWGHEDSLPREMVIALAAAGNIPYGAMVGEELVGYVLGWAGVTPEDGLHIHSHQLATLPEFQQRGVGYALKLAQRAQALDQGISLVRWTFDPLVSRNAWFNLVKLGASADRFLPDFYGEMTDTINAGERSDRLLVRWELDRESAGVSEGHGRYVLGRSDEGDVPRPAEVDSLPSEGAALIQIPREYHELRSQDPGLGEAWRGAVAAALSACFDAGFVVSGYTSDSTYVLQKAGA
jgi:predicted GNAT superfamily acetyltransferase